MCIIIECGRWLGMSRANFAPIWWDLMHLKTDASGGPDISLERATTSGIYAYPTLKKPLVPLPLMSIDHIFSRGCTTRSMFSSWIIALDEN